MWQKDGLGVKGEVDINVFRADGKVEHQHVKNLFVISGMGYLALLQSTTVTSPMNHMHVGTGTVAATLSDLALGGAVGSRAAMASRTLAGSNVLTEVATFSGFITGITSAVLREIGVFNHATTGGTMRSRAVFAAITLADSDFLQFTYRTTVGSV